MPSINFWEVLLSLFLGVPFTIWVLTPLQKWWDRRSDRKREILATREAEREAEDSRLLVDSHLLLLWLGRRVLGATTGAMWVAFMAWSASPAMTPNTTIGDLLKSNPISLIALLLAALLFWVPVFSLHETHVRVRTLHKERDRLVRRDLESQNASLERPRPTTTDLI